MSTIAPVEFYFYENQERKTGKVILPYFDADYTINKLLLMTENSNSSNKRYLMDFILETPSSDNNYQYVIKKQLDLSHVYCAEGLTFYRMFEQLTRYNARMNGSVKRGDPNMQPPESWKKYEAWLEDKEKQNTSLVPSEVAPVVLPEIIYTYNEVSVSDERYPEILEMVKCISIKEQERAASENAEYLVVNVEERALAVLDWVENFEYKSRELSNKNADMADFSLGISKLLNQQAIYIQDNFITPIVGVLEKYFPEKMSFWDRFLCKDENGKTRLFLNEKSQSNVIFSKTQEEVDSIIDELRSILHVDINKFEGIRLKFNDARDKLHSLSQDVKDGIMAINYVENNYPNRFDITVKANTYMQMSTLISMNMAIVDKDNIQFETKTQQLEEMRNVFLPAFSALLQNAANRRLDDNGITQIRSLMGSVKSDIENAGE